MSERTLQDWLALRCECDDQEDDDGPCTMCEARAQLDAQAARIRELEGALEKARERVGYVQDEVDARRANLQQRGGQNVSFHGDFASVPPSALGRIEWHLREIRKALLAADDSARKEK